MTEISEDTVRAGARAWLEANWNPDYGLVEWRLKLAQSGWGVPHWPRHWYGRDLPVGLVPVVEEEFKRIGAIGVAKVGIRTLAAATILEHGTDWQKEKFLLRILTGEDIWCQLFSEPGSGSDVAGAVTRAEFRGNQWVVNGQKVWTTSAHKAHWGLLLARTDFEQPKHRGLSYFILDMKQPGVTVQPLRQMKRLCLVQPGVLYGRQGRARVPRLRRRRRLGGDDDDADARTPRRRRAAQLGDGLRQAGPHL